MLSIRIATIKDISDIQKIAFSTWPVAYSAIITQEQLNYMLDMFYSKESLVDQINTNHTFLLAEQDGLSVGFASFNPIKKDVYKLQKLYVLPSMHKSGAGKLLLNEVISRTRESGAKKLWLNVNRYNKAIGFYEHMGFTIIKEDDINICRDYYMNDFVMEKDLKITAGIR